MYHPLFDRLTQLKCDSMKTALQEQIAQADINSLSFEERQLLLLDREITKRNHQRP